uniref:Myosin phosphatase Rho interacting protein n=1 Tax=Oryzias sinensis TaxID=183150 RepID=A0A8C7XIQ6_9TELE
MSLKDNACKKFQANIFNKSKCQNCFKPRESHLLNDEDLNQAKPMYGGWLLLAPEGTNFDNPLHRSRKWQRRFFILYEHGLLRYALDEMPSTLPQGTINMNQCSDVIDGESRTGQKNSLCIVTPEKEHFIRAECKEIINGWQEALTVYPRTNKQNQKKKRKVDTHTQQDGVTSSQCISTEDMNGHPEPGPAKEESHWSRTTIPCSRSASCLSQMSQRPPDSNVSIQDDGGTASTGRKVRVESGYFSLEKTKSEPSPHTLHQYQAPQHLPLSSSASSSSLGASSSRKRQELRARTRSPGREEVARLFGEERRRSQVIGQFEDGQHAEQMDTSVSNDPSAKTAQIQRQGRSERRYLDTKQDMSLDTGKDCLAPAVSSYSFANLRRAKSLDRRITESSMTPDLLNFKKGWMTKLYEDGMWKKHWFVLTDQSLKYFKDSIAEEALEMDGEIDLSTCYDVKEFPVQRNYGFQILCKEGACTLSAMTSGIRRNWIQAIMKNVRPTIAPDVTRSLPDEKIKGDVTLEPCPQNTPEPIPPPEVSMSDGPRQEQVRSIAAPVSEPRKSRVRERRREGRSKTFDWSEFKVDQTEKPPKERADTVDFSSSCSTASSFCSPSSSASSLASSPVSSSSMQTSSVSVHPPSRTPEMENIRSGGTAPVSTVKGQPSSADGQEEGKMELDHPNVQSHKAKRSSETSNVQEEIEQRWHQVETTPLREAKQVPITSTSRNSERLPAHELAALLDKELGQKQKELDQLQEQNNLLKEQLEDALGREHSAREGYVLQSASPPSSSSPRRVPWQHLHKLNEDLQSELESQKLKQDLAQQQIRTLKRSYTEAQDAVNRHEADIQALQAKLTSAMAEILVGEQAVVRMRNELKSEQQRSKEQEEEYCRGEATLRGQLKDSEDRLRDVEASLLERNQALRQLERQQALQRDHMREVQRLQERLQEVTARLVATEEGQILKEERLKKEQQSMQESHERERQSLCRRLADAERAHKDAEDRLLEAEQQVEALLRGRRASVNREFEEEMLKLQEDLAQKTDLVESLRESVRRLEEERGHLTCRCQELLNQITEADREVNKLRNRLETEEADYCNLEHSYEKATQEFQKISHILREKEEEIQQTKEMYERLMERKEEDLKEALVKMSALGSSLEETEQKLQVKEELLCQMSESLLHKAEPCNAEKDLQAKLVVAEDRIAELELHLRDLQLDYADLHMEREKSQHSLSNIEPTLEDSSKANEMESQAKRPRIRFSSIQCQKYINFEEIDASHSSSLSGEHKDNQEEYPDCPPAEENVSCVIALSQSSDPEKFISIIHALETKLLITEEKLRNLTKNLDVQESSQVEEISKTEPPEVDFSEITSVTHFTKALVCVENSREKVSSILSGSHCTNDSRLHLLSEIENDLFNASLHIRQGQKEEKHKEEQSKSENQYFTAESSDADELQIFTKTLTFEATVLKKMAQLIQTSKSDLLKALVEIWEDIDYAKRTDKDSLALVYASVLSRKLMLESRFWKELEKAETHLQAKESSLSADLDVNTSVVLNTCIKAELAYSIQNLKLCYEEKFQMLKRELSEVHSNLHQRDEALKAIIEASKRPDLSNVIKEVKNTFGFGEQKLADIHPPELAPYMEQIEMEEARDLAEEVVDRQLAGVLSSCAVESLQSFEKAYDSLVSELQRQAALLQRYAVEIQNTGSHPGLSKMIHCVLGRQTSHGLTSSSFCIREALIQAQVAYLACRLQAMHEEDLSLCKQTSQNMDALVQQHARNITAIQEKYEKRLQEECENLMDTVVALERENETLKSEIGKRVDQLAQWQEQMVRTEDHFLKEAEEMKRRHREEMNQIEQGRVTTELALMDTAAESQRKLEVLLVDMDSMEERHESQLRKLEEQFEQRMSELQQAHKEKMEKLHSQYEETLQCAKKYQLDQKTPEVSLLPPCDEAATPMEEEEQGTAAGERDVSEVDSMVVLKDRIQELETQMNNMRDELENKHLEGDVASLREKYQRDFESLKATCERGFAAMEETHQKVVEDLQRQHQREISKLLEERERLLAEETAATIAAIEAMKNAHKEELEKNQRSQLSGLNSDIDELRLQYEEELQSYQRELEVLSEQYSQKCLENAHLAQALEAERQALTQCQRENQELNAHNQELNNRLTAEITRMRSCFSGETALSPLTQGKDLYELEVLLRIKESEIQYLKQEIHSLKDELQSALRDKKYATDKYKDIYTELSIVKAKADCDISKLKEKLLMATEALGERAVEGAVTSGYDIMKSKSNPDFLKKERSTPKPIRGLRSKSVTEQVSLDN